MNGTHVLNARRRTDAPAAEPQRASNCCTEEITDDGGLPRFLAAAQAKAVVGGRDDPFEREADALAQSVLHDEPADERLRSDTAPGDVTPIRRICADCADALIDDIAAPSDVVQRTCDGEKVEAGAPSGPDNPAPLAAPVRTRLEGSLGIDLSAVRVHTGPSANVLAHSLNARAFTHGSDIWLGARQRPDDLGLIAHEVAHVLQQGSGRATPERVQRAPADYRDPQDGGAVAARMQARIDEEVDREEGGDDGDASGVGTGAEGDEAARNHEARSASSQIDRTELAEERAAVQPDARPDVDRPAAERPRVEQAQNATDVEVERPAEPLAEGDADAAQAKSGKGGKAVSAADAAAGFAASAFGAAASQTMPAAQPVVVPPAPVIPVDAGGAALPHDPSADAQAGALAEQAQSLRAEGTRVRALAAEERANAQVLRGNLALVRGGIGQAEQGVATSNQHLATRQEIAAQAREGLAVSEQKAATVAAEAPNFTTKADEGKADSGPMASEASDLAAENEANIPEDEEAAAEAREQGGKMNQAGADIATTDDAVTQTRTRAETLGEDAARAQQTNTETRGKLDAIEERLGSSGERLAQMGEQNVQAREQADALADAPSAQTRQADLLDEQGRALIAASFDVEARLHAVQRDYAQSMASVPAREVNEEGVETPAPEETEAGAGEVVQLQPEDDVTQAPDEAPPEVASGPVEAPVETPEVGTADHTTTETSSTPESVAATTPAPPEAETANATGSVEPEADTALPIETPEPAAPAAPPPPERERVDAAGAVAGALPDWMTGVETPDEKKRAEATAAAEQRRNDDLAEIDRASGGNFESLSAADKMGLALRQTGRNLFGSVSNIKWPGWGHLALGLIDPRGPLMGVVSGLGMMLSGGANLLSGEQWARDPLGNLLKSAADIATGLTVILGSITALAGVIIAIMVAITILSFGTAAPITGPVIAFCTTVLTTVGGWTIAVGKVALVLQALVFIKNLIDAACADTAEELQSEGAQLTENVGDAANVLMQMGMAKAGQLGARGPAAQIQAVGGVRYAATMGARAGVGARAGIAAAGRGIRAAGRGIRAAPGAVARGVRALPTAVARGARAVPGLAGRGVRAVGSGIRSAAGAVGSGIRSAAGAAARTGSRGLAAARALPGRALAGARSLPGRALAGARALPGRIAAAPGNLWRGVRSVPGRLRESFGSGLSREFLVGENIANMNMARGAGAEARAAVWAEARAPGGALAGETRAASALDETMPASPDEARARIGEASPASGAEREASVRNSSRLEGDEITPREAASEVAHVDEHPNLIEGAPPNRRARVGEHEIVETPSSRRAGGIDCERHSGAKIGVPCPVAFGEGKTPQAGAATPVPLTANQELILRRFMTRLEREGLGRDEALHMLGLSGDDELRALVAGARSDAELRALLGARAEELGVTARAEARAAGRGSTPLADEGFEEASSTLGADELRELARSTRPLPTAVERGLLQDAVDEAWARLLHDPEELARYLTRGELEQIISNPNWTSANFGKAVERAVAERLAERPELARFLHTPQRPGVSTPDIGGPIGGKGPRAYDITTSRESAVAAHEKRSYAPFTELIKYPPLPDNYRVPNEVFDFAGLTLLRSPAHAASDTTALPAALSIRSSAAQQLAPAVAFQLGTRLGVDVDRVRIHTDTHADTMSRALHANAFTAGQDIYFRAGHYAPQTRDGRRLLAHELTHTAQQSRRAIDGDDRRGFRVGREHDPLEYEARHAADRVADEPLGDDTRTSSIPRYLQRVHSCVNAPTIQRQPAPEPAKKQPKPAAEAARLAPPAWTDYFDEVVPAVLEAAEGNDKVGLSRAMWLIVQAWGEQSPGVTGVPSRNQNRLFNEQAAVDFEPGTRKIKNVRPGQESEGVYLFSLNQNEAKKRGETDMKRSPTFGYDTPERAAHHHLEQMQSRWGGAWNKLTAEGSSFEEFAGALKQSGYAGAEDYDTKLIEFKQGVETKVRRWLAYRIPTLREREQQMSRYLDMLRDELQAWQAADPDPTGANQHEVERISALLAYHESELAALRARIERMGRFANVLGMKLGGTAPDVRRR